MANKIHLTVVTPSRTLWDEPVDLVILRSTEGNIGVMAGHQQIVFPLDFGYLKITNGDKELIASVLGGFAEVTPEKITVLTDAAEWPEEIDLHRAEEAKTRAEARLQNESGLDLMRAELSLRKALVRIEVSKYNK